MNEKNNLTTYSYHEESVEFGQYDIMFPQTTNQIHKEVKFGCDVDLEEYFEHNYKFLLDIAGAAGTDGNNISNTKATQNAGDFVKLVGMSADGWAITEISGVWADE